jgi:hypothetical protein
LSVLRCLHDWRSSPKRKARPPSVTDRWTGPSPVPAAMGHLSVVSEVRILHSPGPMRYASPNRGGAHLPHNARLRGPTSAAIVSLLAGGNELRWFMNFSSLY